MDCKAIAKSAVVLTLSVQLAGCAVLAQAFNEAANQPHREVADFPNTFVPPPPLPPPPPPLDFWGAAIATVAAVGIGAIALQKDHKNNPGQQVVISDGRLKRDIHLLATLDSGMKIYSFKYLWSDTTYVGVMAQDLLANPAWRDAVVTSPNGFYTVNYGALGLKMVTLEEWQAQGIATIKGGERMSVTKQPQALQPAL